MRRRIVRVALVLATVVGLFGGMTPAAEATTVGTVKIVGTTTLGPGIAYPCWGDGSPDLAKCTVPTATTKPKPGAKHPGDIMVNYHFGPNGASASMTTLACVGHAANAAKPGKLFVEAGLCGLGAAGFVTGYCGLAQGQFTGTVGGSVPIVGLFQVYDFNIKLTLIGTTMHINGSVTKRSTGKSGWIKGTGKVESDPLTGSCANKGPKSFLFQAQVDIKILNDI